MKPKSYSNIIAFAGIAIVISLVTMGSSNEIHKVTGTESTQLDELKKSNELAKETNKLLVQMNKNLEQISQEMQVANKQSKNTEKLLTQMDKSFDQLLKQIDNSKNTISVKEHLEDIKSILQNMD